MQNSETRSTKKNLTCRHYCAALSMLFCSQESKGVHSKEKQKTVISLVQREVREHNWTCIALRCPSSTTNLVSFLIWNPKWVLWNYCQQHKAKIIQDIFGAKFFPWYLTAVRLSATVRKWLKYIPTSKQILQRWKKNLLTFPKWVTKQ